MNIHLNKLPPHSIREGRQWVSLDSEWFDLDIKRGHRNILVDGKPNGSFASLQIATSPEDVYFITDPNLVDLSLARVENCVQVWFNAKFDITQLQRHSPGFRVKSLWDSFIVEKIMWGGYYNTFGLNDLDRRYLSKYMDKSVRKKFEKKTELDDEMIHYGCMDVIDLLKIAKEQKKQISDKALNIYKKIDLPAFQAILDMPGWRLDYYGWMQYAEKNEKVVREIKEGFPFLITSWQQKLAYLHENGINVPNTQRATLEKWLADGKDKKDVLKRLVDYSEVQRDESTYGRSFVDNHLEPDGKVYSNLNVNEAATGRLSATDPNQQNIPVTEIHRSKFLASIGHKMVGADYSGQEPQITAYITQDKRLLEIAKSGKHSHTEVAKIVFGDKLIDKSDDRYKAIKAVNLGMGYGMSKYGLSKRLGCSVPEADELISRYFNIFVGVFSWIQFQRDQSRKDGYVETVLGRRYWLNEYSYGWRNNCLNSPIQGTAADITKLAVSRLHKSCPKVGLPYSLVGIIHDELQNDVVVDAVHEYGKLLKHCMESAGEDICKGIPFIAKVKVGDNWWETH